MSETEVKLPLTITLDRTAGGFRAEVSGTATAPVEASTLHQVLEALEPKLRSLIDDAQGSPITAPDTPRPAEDDLRALRELSKSALGTERLDQIRAQYSHVSRADEPAWVDDDE